ncbi:MAG: hypothetical protein MJZ74_01350, partial [Muribaculaceae bacterium]|nr:hypothetical protein [Muribaculaceae bacterium]
NTPKLPFLRHICDIPLQKIPSFPPKKFLSNPPFPSHFLPFTPQFNKNFPLQKPIFFFTKQCEFTMKRWASFFVLSNIFTNFAQKKSISSKTVDEENIISSNYMHNGIVGFDGLP